MNWIKNTTGKRDAMLTLAVIGFAIVVLKLLFAGNSLVIDTTVYSFGEIDAAEITAILTPTLGAYVTRRYTDRKWEDLLNTEDDEDFESGE